MYYRLLPQKTLASHSEKCADGRKAPKERVTINACSNASGTIKLPLVLIGMYANPRCFKHIKKEYLPVVYANQTNAWMSASIFSDWFHCHFVPTVTRRLQELGVEPKAVLVLDNCSAHPSEDELVSHNKKIVAKFLPPNVTSLIQPMDQGVLELLKRLYRRKLLEKLVLRNDEGISIKDFAKSINMLQVCNLISKSWSEITPKTLRLSWRKILPDKPSSPEVEPDHETPTSPPDPTVNVDEVRRTFHRLGVDLNETETTEWLESDKHDQGCEHLTDEDIVASVLQHNEQPLNEEQPAEEVAERVSHAEAEYMFDRCILWIQDQEEASMYSIRTLQELSDLAARKKANMLKQKKVSDYFHAIVEK